MRDLIYRPTFEMTFLKSLLNTEVSLTSQKGPLRSSNYQENKNERIVKSDSNVPIKSGYNKLRGVR